MTRTKKSDRPARVVLRQPVEKIWLAGLGALALTEQEGTKLFKTLVKRGEGFERDTKERIDQSVATAKAAPEKVLTRIEAGVDVALTEVLHRLGIPTSREIRNLTRRVEGLASSLERRPARRPRRRAAKAKAQPAVPTA